MTTRIVFLSHRSTIPTASIPADSQIGALALTRPELDLSDVARQCGFDALYCVLESLRDPQGPHEVVELELLECMRRVCELLGLDYNAVVARRYSSVAELERCKYELRSYEASGTLYFENQLAVLELRCVRGRFKGKFAYQPSPAGFRVKRVRQFHSLLFKPDGVDLVLVWPNPELAGTTARSLRFVNQTPSEARAAPAPPSYFERARPRAPLGLYSESANEMYQEEEIVLK